jgi:hypothetical protein
MTTTAKKRPAAKTAPRKAAKRVPTNGQATANGAVAGPAEEFVPFPPPELTAGIVDPGAPPQEFIATTKPEGDKPAVPAHPYGNREVYVFTPVKGSNPKDPAGDAPIVFPAIFTIRPDYHFMWKLRKLDQVQQSFEWMDQASVPDEIQERVTWLSDDEQARFFMGWFGPAVNPQTQVGPPGES